MTDSTKPCFIRLNASTGEEASAAVVWCGRHQDWEQEVFTLEEAAKAAAKHEAGYDG